MLILKIYLLVGVGYTIYRLIHVFGIQEVFRTIGDMILTILFWILDFVIYIIKEVGKRRYYKHTGKDYVSLGDIIKLGFKKNNNLYVYTRLCFINKNKLKELRK